VVTQKQIAQQLGVSQSAVAFAFHPTLRTHLSTPKRQRILAAAEQLGSSIKPASSTSVVRPSFLTPFVWP
jgi:DNA-binding LacI/PurR family transcriptional regulator